MLKDKEGLSEKLFQELILVLLPAVTFGDEKHIKELITKLACCFKGAGFLSPEEVGVKIREAVTQERARLLNACLDKLDVEDSIQAKIEEAKKQEGERIIANLQSGIAKDYITITEKKMKALGQNICSLFEKSKTLPKDALIVLEFVKASIWGEALKGGS